jgi:hypothetical protein
MVNGEIIRTSYGTGPFVITDIYGPCNCPAYLDENNNGNAAKETDEHYHLTCQAVTDEGVIINETPSYLNHYRRDGTHISREHWLIFESGHVVGQMDLF